MRTLFHRPFTGPPCRINIGRLDFKDEFHIAPLGGFGSTNVAVLGSEALKIAHHWPKGALCNIACLCGLVAFLVSGCGARSRLAEPPTLAMASLPLFEGTPSAFAPNVATPIRKIRARSCHYMDDRDAAKREVDASLRRQAAAKYASAVVRIKYREITYNNRGSCRPGLLAVGTPVVLHVAGE